ncbi:type II toxin-antitoxin system RelB/DinJ family antitoxin [Lapidilactobacillus bayanensis]|uniref:type II toxin-antitoxin system RelB/DinJ family antitoxin n=1 Tax=Lapidilactobacillus bayanensis TaxID=2485998 RepID=UPI001CDD01AF|nr:type II toxin-antitoxin system RelB/DinJ family antitoxin [Lapidilactobacillus bayanensis]
MMTTTKKDSISIRVDSNLKDEAEEVLDSMGLNYTTAITLFLKAVTNEGKIPFEIKSDSFYSRANQKQLKHSINQLETGHVEKKSLIE